MSSATCLQRVTCVIPAFNSAGVIASALRSLPAGVRIIVVDNASGDSTVSVVASTRPEAKIIACKVNGGFAWACNEGWRAAETPFVTFVNPDLEVRPGALEAVLQAAETDSRIAILGSPDSIKGDQATGAVADAAMVSGAFMTVRRSAFGPDAVFDPAIFMYFEDFDVCVRARAEGKRVVLVRDAGVIHSEGKSTGSRYDNLLEKAWLWGGACQYFAIKHRDKPEGAKAAGKIRNYRRKARLQRLFAFSREAALNRAKVAGAEAVVRHGPEALHDNGFVTGSWRTAHLAR